MGKFFSLFNNIIKLFPYLFLIFIYFLVINLEARKQLIENSPSNHEKNIEYNKLSNSNNNKTNNSQKRIRIKVIPYKNQY
tara:strand:- start:415 stop:654 length:240 start_codon:yes stop_codon:yes gene_type:complete